MICKNCGVEITKANWVDIAIIDGEPKWLEGIVQVNDDGVPDLSECNQYIRKKFGYRLKDVMTYMKNRETKKLIPDDFIVDFCGLHCLQCDAIN